MATHLAVFITAKDMQQAENIARHLLEDHLAACVNIVPTVHSHFWWEGKLDHSQECLLMVKTLRERLPRLVDKVKQLHSYTVPEVIALDIVGGNADYLNWVQKETGVLNWTPEPEPDYPILDVEPAWQAEVQAPSAPALVLSLKETPAVAEPPKDAAPEPSLKETPAVVESPVKVAAAPPEPDLPDAEFTLDI